MKTLLTICIPTYKRPMTLRRSIELLTSQIEKFDLSECIDIYVADDASPDGTGDLLNSFAHLAYFQFVSRAHNLGMNVNIKHMLSEVARKSHFQLIITDDDFIQPDVLGEMVEFLKALQDDPNKVSAVWTPRNSYTEDGALHCIICDSFESNAVILPSAINAGRYMLNGFVLSGLIVSACDLDFDFWEEYEENAMFPMIFFGELVLRDRAYYWNSNVVHHTVLNKCHWERWGKSDLLIEIRLFSDSLNAYSLVARRIGKHFDLIKFYCAALPSIVHLVRNMMYSNNLKIERSEILDAICEQKKRGVLTIENPVRLLLDCALLVNSIVGSLKLTALNLLSYIVRVKNKRKHYRERARAYFEFLRTIPIIFRVIH